MSHALDETVHTSDPHIEEAGLARLDKRLLDVVREFSDRYLQFL